MVVSDRASSEAGSGTGGRGTRDIETDAAAALEFSSMPAPRSSHEDFNAPGRQLCDERELLAREKGALARRLEELHSRRQINLEQRAVLEEIDVDVEDVRRERVDPAEQLRRVAQRNFATRRRLEDEDSRLTREIEALQEEIRALERRIGRAKG